MFIGHFPAGYCLTKTMLNGIHCQNKRINILYFWVGLIASVLPDLDMIYFYFIDHRQHLHHSYWTHIPFYWITIATGLISLGWLINRSIIVWGALIGLTNIMVHLCLDSIASRIQWLYPISNRYFGLVQVPSRYGWWVWNYIAHWTFAFEVMIVIIAAYMFYYPKHMEPSIKYPKGNVYAGDHINR